MKDTDSFPLIDLHMHTTCSDGTDTPEEILRKVKEAGISLFSVTDHDAIKGCSTIGELLTEDDPVFLTGVEFSCQDEDGKYHILGYGYDPGAEAIRTLVEIGHHNRMVKLKKRLDFLREEFGFVFTEDEIAHLFALNNPGKPHIARCMVDHGYADSRAEAIDRYLDKLSLRKEYLRPEEAIRGILKSSGIPVLAHPAFGNGAQRIRGKALDRRIRRLIDFGLEGVEAFYSGFPEEIRREVLSCADRYGLYITAGSDYHGLNKTIRLGDTGLDEFSFVPEGLHRFLHDIMK